MSRLYLSIYFPEWSTASHRDVRGTINNEPVVLVPTSSRQMRVVRLNTVAKQLGITEGMRLTFAHARAAVHKTKLNVFPYNDEEDYSLFSALAQAMLRFSPVVGIDRERTKAHRAKELCLSIYNGLILDFTGCEKVYPSWVDLTKTILDLLAAFNLVTRMALTPSVGGSWALARYGEQAINIVTDIDEMLRQIMPLPISALRISSEVQGHLGDLGIHKIAEIMALPRRNLLRRFGKEVIANIAHATGEAHELIKRVAAPTRYNINIPCEPPVTDSIKLVRVVVRGLLRLIYKMHENCYAATDYEITVVTTIGSTTRCCTLRAIPPLSRQNKVSSYLDRILTPLFDKHPAPAPVAKITLKALNPAPRIAVQADTWGGAQHHQEHLCLIDELCAVMSAQSVCRLSFQESWIPEHASTFIPFNDKTESVLPSSIVWGERPPFMLQAPEPIRVRSYTEKGLPIEIDWRDTAHTILRTKGRERITHEWWREDVGITASGVPVRDYYYVQTSKGIWLWIFHENTEIPWKVHGVWW